MKCKCQLAFVQHARRGNIPTLGRGWAMETVISVNSAMRGNIPRLSRQHAPIASTESTRTSVGPPIAHPAGMKTPFSRLKAWAKVLCTTACAWMVIHPAALALAAALGLGLGAR